MAYGNYLASISPEQVHLLRQCVTSKLAPTKVVLVTHLTGYWVKHQPLGDLLGRALDGGELLSSVLSHPLRDPKFHTPSEALVLFRDISAVWHEVLMGEPFPEREWFREDIERLLSVFERAVQDKHGVVSLLEPPLDAERANHVHIPFDIPATNT